MQRADHLVVLRFLAQAEKLPEKVLDSYLSEDKLMESDLYSSILSKGKAQGEAEILIRILMARLGRLAPEVKAAIYAQAKADPEALSVWVEDAIRAMDADAARRLVSKITAA